MGKANLLWFLTNPKYFNITEEEAKEYVLQGNITVEGQMITLSDLYDYPSMDDGNGRSKVEITFPNGYKEEWIY